jgi:transcriptional regulator with XRE-family HTH domain
MESENSIGTRLRAERERLEMNQTQFAEKAGVTRNTQGLYETGARSPDGNYFAAVAEIGVDVAFVLVGPNRLKVEVTPRELALIDRYRLSHPDVQRGVEALLAATGKVKSGDTAEEIILDLTMMEEKKP